jgi:hypothetical protein
VTVQRLFLVVLHEHGLEGELQILRDIFLLARGAEYQVPRGWKRGREGGRVTVGEGGREESRRVKERACGLFPSIPPSLPPSLPPSHPPSQAFLNDNRQALSGAHSAAAELDIRSGN